MDSITKLQSKLREAESILQYVSKELEGFAEDKSVGTKLNFAEIKLRGEQYAFYEHPLKKQIFQDEYFALMIYVISLGGKKEEGWTLLYQIVAGCDYQKDLQNLATDAMTLGEERLSEIIRMIYSAELARTFALDSLMICYHMGADEAQLKFLSNFYDLLKLDKNFLTEAIQFVKIYDYTFWDNLAEKSRPWKYLTAKDIATYIGGYPAASLEEAAKLKYDRVAVSGITYSGKDVLNLDNWKVNDILFMNCRFENCGGIASNDKVIKFLNCTFERNIRRWRPPNYPSRGEWINNQYSAYRGFLHFNKAEFLDCSFKNFSADVPLMYLNGGSIHLCDFEKCSQVWSSNILLYVKNTQVTGTKFVNIFRQGAQQLCMIYSSNSKWIQNTFLDCRSRFEYNPSNAKEPFNCLILLDENSYCTQCLFERNEVHNPPVYTIGLCNSKQSDNTGDLSIGEIKDISRDMFIVGDKHYDP